MLSTTLRKPLAIAVTIVALGALAGCSSSGDAGSTDAAGGTYTWWDPYPQHEEGSDWAKRVQACGTDAGVTIQRTAYDTTSLTNQALLSAQEGTSPDVILLDNPAVSTLADTGMLTTTDELGLDTSKVDANLLAAGELDSADYGVPVGANTLALYYNADILTAAGVDPASITSWASLTDALSKVTAAGKKGITFAGINTEEGSFQFLPWFWGAGAVMNSPPVGAGAMPESTAGSSITPVLKGCSAALLTCHVPFSAKAKSPVRNSSQLVF
ncbi:hypothetical protein C5E11_17860 [Clavibacter michiganensis]|nr:hypothetical protein C5E11_17860 [Clavibacter michiganensis]